jgi:hypothetical protein
MVNLDVTTPYAFSVRAAPVNPVSVSAGGNAVILVPTPGVPGPEGPPGTSTPIVGEVPAGTRNGVNENFTTLYGFVAASTAVYRNGLREVLNIGYLETSSTTIQFTTAPLVSDYISIDYLKG